MRAASPGGFRRRTGYVLLTVPRAKKVYRDARSPLDQTAIIPGDTNTYKMAKPKAKKKRNAAALIEEVVKNRADVLDLQRLWLTECPTELRRVSWIRKLDLYTNSISALPDWLSDFKNLEELNLGANRFSEFPEILLTLPRLRMLYFWDNPLIGLSPRIFELRNLEKLTLTKNGLSEFPEGFDQLTRLTSLTLAFNPVKYLPPSLFKLKGLRTLQILHMNLLSLPPEIGNLTSLSSLSIDQNPLTELPVALARCTQLRDLNVRRLKSLRFPPGDVVELGGDAVLRYLREAAHGQETVWESKLLLVGEGTVGKTWLYEALNGRNCGGSKAGLGATIGIEIGPLIIDQAGGTQMRLNCWDFAGQDITHATHQFFFSERTLFVVCWNARAGWEAGKLRKWLTNIRDRAPSARVLLVATHADQQHSDYPEKELRDEFKQITGTFKVSSLSGEGISALLRAIAVTAQELPMMGLRWPAKWRQAQQAVLGLRADGPYATIATVLETMVNSGLQEQDAAVLLRWLHELGEVLHYAAVPELAELVMLDPQWVTRHVGAVLASSDVQKAKGILTRQCLVRLWPELDDHVRQHLLGMMERFDLAYRIPDVPDHRCLVVERLQQDAAEYEALWATFGEQPEVRLRYRLKAMHPGIPTWFIARCHRFTLGLHWLRGVLFGDNRSSPRHLALIIAIESERTVDFSVRGPQPWTFLPLLTDGFEDTITSRYPGLEFERIAPCPGLRKDGSRCDFEFSVTDLEALRWPIEPQEVPEYEIRCTRCRTKHTIDTLLLGLSSATGRDEAKLAEILSAVHAEGAETREFMTQSMEAALRFIQLAFVDEWNKEQELAEQSCPTVFALYPLDGPTLTRTSTMRLQLYCMNPSCWHQVKENGVCEFKPVREGFISAARWAHKAAKWIRPAAMLLPGAVELTGEYSTAAHSFAENAKAELKLTADIFKEIKDMPELGDNPNEDLVSSRSARNHERNTNLRGLKAFLDKLPFPVMPYGGLRRIRTPEGHVLWLCPEHAAEFRQGGSSAV
jgi:GTPase SAR1 family protein